MKVSAPHRGWTSGRATPSLRPNPYGAETANPAGRHLSFAEICPDNRGQLYRASRLCGAGDASDQGQACTVARGRPLDQDGHGEVPKDGLRIASNATFGLRRGETH